MKPKPVIQQLEEEMEGYVLFVCMRAWMHLTEEPGEAPKIVYWRKKY